MTVPEKQTPTPQPIDPLVVQYQEQMEEIERQEFDQFLAAVLKAKGIQPPPAKQAPPSKTEPQEWLIGMGILALVVAGGFVLMVLIALVKLIIANFIPLLILGWIVFAITAFVVTRQEANA